MRIELRVSLLGTLAACATAATTTPAPVAPVPAPRSRARAHTRLVPAGMFVRDLLGHRLDTTDAFWAQRAAVQDPCVVDVVCLPLVPINPFAIARAVIRTPTVLPSRTAIGDVRDDEGTIVEVCIDETGAVTSARTTNHRSSPVDRVRTWRFAPYFVRGKPMAVCGYVWFDADGHERVADPTE